MLHLCLKLIVGNSWGFPLCGFCLLAKLVCIMESCFLMFHLLVNKKSHFEIGRL